MGKLHAVDYAGNRCAACPQSIGNDQSAAVGFYSRYFLILGLKLLHFRPILHRVNIHIHLSGIIVVRHWRNYP